MRDREHSEQTTDNPRHPVSGGMAIMKCHKCSKQWMRHTAKSYDRQRPASVEKAIELSLTRRGQREYLE